MSVIYVERGLPSTTILNVIYRPIKKKAGIKFL